MNRIEIHHYEINNIIENNFAIVIQKFAKRLSELYHEFIVDYGNSDINYFLAVWLGHTNSDVCFDQITTNLLAYYINMELINQDDVEDTKIVLRDLVEGKTVQVLNIIKGWIEFYEAE